MKRAGFEEVPRLAGTTVPVSRLARRWAREPLPYAQQGTLPWGAYASVRPTALHVTFRRGRCPHRPVLPRLLLCIRRGRPPGRPTRLCTALLAKNDVIARAHRARGNPHLPSPKSPLPKRGGPAALWWRDTCRVWGIRLQEAGAGIPVKRDRLLGRSLRGYTLLY